MKKKNSHIEQLLNRYNALIPMRNKIEKAANLIIQSYQIGGKLLICGNGGSSSDSEHFVGELMKGFEKKRPIDKILKDSLLMLSNDRGTFLSNNLQQGLPAISLSAHTALTSAVVNDIGADIVFAQQVAGYGILGDVLIGFSTSGNSKNVVDALITAKAKGLITIGFTGESGGKMKEFCDVIINVPEKRTAFVQELHLPVYHVICLIVEDYFFKQ